MGFAAPAGQTRNDQRIIEAVAGGTSRQRRVTLTVQAMLHLFGVRGFAFFLVRSGLMNMVIFAAGLVSFFSACPWSFWPCKWCWDCVRRYPRFIRHRTVRRDVLSRGLALGIRECKKPISSAAAFFDLSGPHLDRRMLALVLSMMVALPIRFSTCTSFLTSLCWRWALCSATGRSLRPRTSSRWIFGCSARSATWPKPLRARQRSKRGFFERKNAYLPASMSVLFSLAKPREIESDNPADCAASFLAGPVPEAARWMGRMKLPRFLLWRYV